MDALISLVTQVWRNPQWLWGLLIVPLVPVLYALTQRRARKLIARFGEIAVLKASAIEADSRQRWIRVALFAAALTAGFVAAARPQWGSSTEIVQTTGLDIVLLLDTSLSMLAQDMKPTRMEAAKLEIGAFLDRLRTDRVALVPFAGSAFIQCPLTLDYSAVRLFLRDVTTYSVMDEGTDIGAAIRTGLKAFNEDEDRSKVVVLVTDGEDHGGTALDAAQEAADASARIYTVGIGSPDGELIPSVGLDGRPDFVRDDQGSVVKTRLDEDMLREVAIETGGEYFRSSPGGTELEAILEGIGEMERARLGEYQTSARIDRYQAPLALSVLLFLAIPFVPERPARRRTR